MQTWQDKNPDMKYILWTEEYIDHFGLLNREKYDYFMAKKLYDGAADVARIEILNRLGGVYIDADSICFEPIQNEFFMQRLFFAGIEYDDRVANGVIGSIAHHPILVDYVARISRATVLEPVRYTLGGTMLTSCIDDYGRRFVMLLPRAAFYPRWKHRGEITTKMYARQMWGSTKKLYA